MPANSAESARVTAFPPLVGLCFHALCARYPDTPEKTTVPLMRQKSHPCPSVGGRSRGASIRVLELCRPLGGPWPEWSPSSAWLT
jgi:hypothetical protein